MYRCTTGGDYIATPRLESSSVFSGEKKPDAKDLVAMKEEILADIRLLRAETRKLVGSMGDTLGAMLSGVDGRVNEILAILKTRAKSADPANSIEVKKENCGPGGSMAPYPGTGADYNFLFDVITKYKGCKSCCACMNGDVCLFIMYSGLQNLLGKYPDWEPKKTFAPMKPENSSGAGMLLEISLRLLKKARCSNCYLCKFINADPKLSALFGSSIFDLFYTGEIHDDSLRAMLFQMTSTAQTNDLSNNALQQYLLMMLAEKSSPPTCPSRQTNTLNCQQIPGQKTNCQTNCPLNTQTNTRPIPRYRDEINPAYGRTPQEHQNTENKNQPTQPAYGKNYGAF